MNSYIFFVGRFTQLSYAELFARYGAKFEVIDRQFTLMNLARPFERQELYSLGGIMKVAEVLHSCPEKEMNEQQIAEWIGANILTTMPKEGEKFRYGVNVMGRTKLRLAMILNHSKKAAKKAGVSVRFVNKNLNKNISSVVIGKERLVEKGADITICVYKGMLYITRTVASQNFEEYSDRDFEKPVRDMEGGIMPPKLAQMMINMALGSDRQEKRVYDPFCGSGTLVMEGMLQKLEMLGSDVNAQAVEDARTNCTWLEQSYAFRKPTPAQLFVHDATKEFPELGRINAMVSESFLGPTLHSLPGMKRIQEILDDVRRMHKLFFAHAHKVLEDGGVIVISFPFYPNHAKPIFIEKLLDKIHALGYTTDDLLPEDVLQALGQRKSTRNSLLYVRDDQVVGREIFKFVRTATQ